MAELLDNYASANQDATTTFCGAGRPIIEAQSFTTPNDGIQYTLTSCKFWLKNTTGAVGNVCAKLYSHAGVYGVSSVGNAVLATSDNVDVTTIGIAFGWVVFTFADVYVMNANTNFVIACVDVNCDLNLTIGWDGSTPAHSGNICYVLTTTWTYSASYDACFEVYGEPPAAVGGGEFGIGKTSLVLTL